jgi:hypothetical protein
VSHKYLCLEVFGSHSRGHASRCCSPFAVEECWYANCRLHYPRYCSGGEVIKTKDWPAFLRIDGARVAQNKAAILETTLHILPETRPIGVSTVGWQAAGGRSIVETWRRSVPTHPGSVGPSQIVSFHPGSELDPRTTVDRSGAGPAHKKPFARREVFPREVVVQLCRTGCRPVP